MRAAHKAVRGQDVRKHGAVTAVAKEAQEKIAAIRLALAKRLGKQRFDLWFGTPDTVSVVNGTVRIGLPNLLFQKWVAQQFRDDIAAACTEVLGFSPKIEFSPLNGTEESDGAHHERDCSFAPSSNGQSGAKPQSGQADASCSLLPRPAQVEHFSSDPHEDPIAQDATHRSESCSTSVDESVRSDRKCPGNGPTDLSTNPDCSQPLGEGSTPCQNGRTSFPTSESSDCEPVLFPELATGAAASPSARRRKRGSPRPQVAPSSDAEKESTAGAESRRRFLTFAEFAVGPCNQLAYATAVEVARHPGQLSPLFLSGPTSVGKTHLLQAIIEEVRRLHPRLWVVYVSADDFMTAYVGALRNGGLPSFRSKFRQVDLLAVDDIQVLIGKHWVQRELLLTIDALLREGKQVVLAADRPLQQLTDFGQDFVARIQSGVSCWLDWPDCETRRAIVDRLCERLGLPLPTEVRQFVAHHVAGHARELLGALRRLQAVMITSGTTPDRPAAENVLADLVRIRHRPVRLGDICEAVCEAFGIEPERLVGPERTQAVAQPRLVAMWLARKFTRSGLSEISRYFGRKSHSAVLAAQRTVEQWLAENRALRVADRLVPIPEIIRHLERRLQAG